MGSGVLHLWFRARRCSGGIVIRRRRGPGALRFLGALSCRRDPFRFDGGAAVFAAPGIGTAVASVYVAWAAVGIAASIAGVHPMAHSLVGTPVAAASTLYDYFLSNDIPPEFCEEALNKALATFHEFIVYASDGLDYWVVPIWPPGTEPPAP